MSRFRGKFALLVLVSLTACDSGSNQTADLDCNGDSCDVLGPFGELTNFTQDPRFTARDRLFISNDTSTTGRRAREPFSHRQKRWHVYPFVSYGEASYRIELSVHDPLMHEQSAVWVLGPKQADGSWPVYDAVRTQKGAAPQLIIDADEFEEFAIIVGPKTEQGFLPRYPGNVLHLAPQTQEELNAAYPDADFRRGRLKMEDGHVKLTFGARSCTVLSQPSRYSSGANTALQCEFDGTSHTLRVASWTQESYWRTAGVKTAMPKLGALDTPEVGQFQFEDEAQPYLVVKEVYADAVTANSTPTDEIVGRVPDLLELAPSSVAGHPVQLVESEDCREKDEEDALCLIPMAVDDAGKPIANIRVPIKAVSATFRDPEETSTYSLSLQCQGDCQTKLPPPTQYPLYLAHGFNSDKNTWFQVVNMLNTAPEWRGWVRADDVPGQLPIAYRAEQLRRNLDTFLRNLKEVRPLPEGETYYRVNILAHSMGGLDSRMLTGQSAELGTDRYNNEQCHERLDCTNEDGEPEPCCIADADGNAVMWRDRIVSVTTLSTPHKGSPFATWGYAHLTGVGWVTDIFEAAAGLMFGVDRKLDPERFHLFLEQMRNMTIDYGTNVLGKELPAVISERAYDFRCVVEGECSDIAPEHAPRKDDRGRVLLPSPADRTTFFSWAAETCLAGGCGHIVSPAVLVPFSVVASKIDEPHDGLVSRSSSVFGIFMGTRLTDHFGWMAPGAQNGANEALAAFQGSGSAENWYQYWIAQLVRSGY